VRDFRPRVGFQRGHPVRGSFANFGSRPHPSHSPTLEERPNLRARLSLGCPHRITPEVEARLCELRRVQADRAPADSPSSSPGRGSSYARPGRPRYRILVRNHLLPDVPQSKDTLMTPHLRSDEHLLRELRRTEQQRHQEVDRRLEDRPRRARARCLNPSLPSASVDPLNQSSSSGKPNARVAFRTWCWTAHELRDRS
jgi:hypothetical protein